MSTVADKLAKKSSSKTSAKQVRLRLVYVDFWSAVKLSFLAAVAIAIVTVVASFLIYTVLSTTGLIGKLDDLFKAFDDNFTLSDVINLPQVMAFSSVVAI
jgi:ABC-type tungstate transport system substrate-binding protein